MSNDTLKLELPGNPGYAQAVLAFAREFAEQLGFESRDTAQIEKAMHEAVLNVMQQTQPDSEIKGRICIEFEPNPSGLSIIIRRISSLDGDGYEPPVIEQPLEQITDSNVGGLGFYLIDNAFDAVHFNTVGRQGMEIRLNKHIPIKHISSFRADERTKNPVHKRIEIPVHFNPNMVIVRPLDYSEAVQVSYYAFKAFGYLYGEYVYYPAALVEKNINGELISVVAQSPDGDIIGHGALEFPRAGGQTAEIGVVFVRPEYRGLGISARIFEYLHNKAQELGLAGLYARICTANRAMQKTSGAYGSINCGFWLGAVPRIDTQGQRQTSGLRESLFLGFLPLKTRPPVVIYPPAEDREIIKKIYASMQLPVIIGTDSAAPPPESSCSVIHAIMNPDARMAVIEVVEAGPDTASELTQRLGNYLREQILVVYLYLDLQNPATEALAEECKQRGYIFAGIIPYGSNRGKDALVLQFLHNISIEYDIIHPHSELAVETLEYIKKQHEQSSSPFPPG